MKFRSTNTLVTNILFTGAVLTWVFAILFCATITAVAQIQVPCVDTNDGVKYVQQPNLQGLDVWNSGPWMLADDFICTNIGPISDIHIWGSWLNDLVNQNSLTFHLGIYG